MSQFSPKSLPATCRLTCLHFIALGCWLCLIISSIAWGDGNPILPGWWADPEARIFDKTCYIYPSTDASPTDATFDAFSSTDLKHWQHFFHVLDFATIPWTGNRYAWAPSVVECHAHYYMYFSAGDGTGIGVATADKPTGPFVDPLQHALVKGAPHGAEPIDPMAFIDPSGQAYLYFGGHAHCVGAKLDKEMISIDSDWTEVTPKGYIEGVFMFKRNATYLAGQKVIG